MSDDPIFDPETGEVLEAGDTPPPVPAMSLDEARAMLVREHGVAIGSDDPLLMLITLHQGMLRDYERMLARHDAAIAAILGTTGAACADAVETVLASLKDKTVKASLDQAFALVERQALAMEDLRRALRSHRRVTALLTTLSLAGCVLALTILFSIVR
ncbi:hypothetical protein [Magnetospirillum fulvum]|uniref:Conjugal transfer protein TraM n=1 Tax=Magnetospirillum fulvum MGU-K5 TaxID=1316936 RepID=S9S7S2_MAGFU|nr:hypothetical protein [Magnetospirillum fulvum]EPY00133.1 hypothetical protein K678_17641 [Magnetospirillum fulvum MGU-K5]